MVTLREMGESRVRDSSDLVRGQLWQECGGNGTKGGATKENERKCSQVEAGWYRVRVPQNMSLAP